MKSKRKTGGRTAKKTEFDKIFEDAHKKLREISEIESVQKIHITEENAKPAPISFPYGGKGYNDWVSS